MKSSKTALVTGGTSGVGLSIVKSLVQQNYRVFFVGRNKKLGDTLASELNNIRPEQAKYVYLDLSNLSEVYAFTERFIKDWPNIDLLANIAGVVLPEKETTPEGFERTFAIGYLSSFILSTELKTIIKRGGRIVNVGAHPKTILKASLDFKNQDLNSNYNGFKVSTQTIHAKTVLSSILAEQYLSEGIDVNSFHPGMVRSHLSRHLPFPYKTLAKAFTPLMSKESKTGIYVSSSSTIIGITGQLFLNNRPVPLQFDKQYKEDLWKKTIEMLVKIRQQKNYKIGWILNERIAALTHFHSAITENDIRGVFTETQKLLEKVKRPFQIVIDNRLAPISKIAKLEELLKSAPILDHPLLQNIIVVKPLHLDLSNQDGEVQKIKHIHLKNVSSITEALDFASHHIGVNIKENDATFFPDLDMRNN